MKKGKHNYSDSSDDEDERVPLKKAEQDNKLWDAFQDPPVQETSGSSADFSRLETIIKLLKVFTFLFVFIVILASSVVSKMSLLFMTSHIKKNVTVPFCDLTQPEKQFNAEIPLEQRIAWIWAIVFAFSVPEAGTIIRAFRICFFKNKRTPTFGEWGTVALFESLHVIGLAILVMYVLPEMDVIKGVMLTNCLCLIPGILSFITKPTIKSKFGFKLGMDALAIGLQITGLVVWPLMNNKLELWFIPAALLLISFHWWENYVADNCFIGFISSLAQKRDQIHESRYFMYLTIAPWKIILFLLSVMAMSGEHFLDFFNLFIKGWSIHPVNIIETLPIFSDTLPNLTSIITSQGQITTVNSTHLSIFYVFLTHMLASYICYVFSKFACKIQIQSFSFAFPVNLTVPATVSVLLILCGLRESDVCYFHQVLPDYLFFKSPPIYNLLDFLTNEYAWIWILWLISQSWITQHIWTPKCDKNASTDVLFVSPLYNSLIIDQSLTMNRRRDDKEEHFKINQKQEIDESDLTKIEVEAKATNADNNKHDSIPQIFICATMWHENKEEMMEFLKSILRLDEDQCARRMAKRYLRQENDTDQEYYDLETHIFFDDAFVGDKKKVEDPDASPINAYVKLLINNLEEAAREVYKTKMKIYPPTKVVTPYGGRLIWTLPGRTKMIAHLKNKNKIRHKKRWSQVMYMYYLLGYRIMQLDISTERKLLIAQNTYLLALDGDIDFQPKAVSLLIGRMKVDPDLGAACGRIHPIGNGPMVWYQVFEYAIGHWLQKSTEHIIGCVLCSPGCFSLFRGRALMENSVMKKYTTTSENPLHYVQYDQGEDRWLCTLLLKQQFRVEYSAASDAYTHAPEGFNEFYNQRRRWVPSTMANILDLLGDAKTIVKKNNSISMPYIMYQAMMMGGSLLGPGTIFLMMVGSLVAVFNINQWTSFLWNFIPILIFMGICYFCKQKHQLTAAFVISTIYGLVMMAVFIGIVIQTMEDGILSPTTLFFLLVVFQVVITGLLHPQEAGALICGLVYYITIPSMYMLLVIYSLFNMNDVSWGTRENPADKPEPKQEQQTQEPEQGRLNKMFSFLQSGKQKEEGSIDFSFAGLFRCMFCTHPKSNDEQAQLLQIANQLGEINSKMKDLEMKLTGEVTVMRSESTISSAPSLKKESIEELPEKSINYLPDWLYDTDLRNGETETLGSTEEKFWNDLIEKYLKPIDKSQAELDDVKAGLKGLRDMSVFAFVMINAIFVLVVFILQLNKDLIHVRWPLGAKNFIVFDDSTTEITISREYLELDPIGLVFIIFFGIILFIQFGAMLLHRFSTISQILATTALDWYCGKQPEEMSEAEELRGKAVDIAMHLQKPEAQWDENEMSKDESVIGRRDTIHRILYQHKNKQDWSNLEANFKRRIFADGDLQMGRVTVSRKTINLLDNRRKSMKDIRIHRKSVKINQQMMTDPYDTTEPQWMQHQQQQHQQMRHNPAPPPDYNRMESDLNPRILNSQGNDNRGYEVASSESDDDFGDFEMTDKNEDKKRVAFA